MNKLEIDGRPERAFRQMIEAQLREGAANAALARLRALLKPFCGDSGLLPPRFLTIRPEEIGFDGWPETLDWLSSLDARSTRPITAIGIDVSRRDQRAEAAPDLRGDLDPHIETNFYSDSAWPFSTSDRAGLLRGYADGAVAWRGDFEDCAEFLWTRGMSDLYGAWRRLDAKPGRALDEDKASALAAMFIQVLLHLAVREAAPLRTFPRPMAVLVGSDGEYPFFDAPVFTAKP